MFVLPGSLASAGLALQRQSEGWLGWDGTRASPLVVEVPCRSSPLPPFPLPLPTSLRAVQREAAADGCRVAACHSFEMAGALHAVVWKFLATWQVRRCRRNVPLFWEVRPRKARCSLAGSRVLDFGFLCRSVGEAGRCRGRPRLGADELDIDILRLVELLGFQKTPLLIPIF